MQNSGKTMPLNWRFLSLTVVVVTALFALGFYRLDIDTDIVGSLPQSDPVIADAAYLFTHHPMQSQVVIDVALGKTDLDVLIAAGRLVEKRLAQSGLFRSVGLEDMQKLMPGLIDTVTQNLPVLFSAAELRERIQPLTETAAIKQRLGQLLASLQGLESIGQAALMSRDPLDFRALVLARLSQLAPATGARIQQGHLLSADGRHLLVTAAPHSSGTDTVFARAATKLLDAVAAELQREFGRADQQVRLTPVGAYRAALDNELIIRRDVAVAITLATIGIAVLLLFAFPRPVLGLFSLLPAVAGTMLALFVFSLFHESVSIMVLGFGGAIISITVDQGIAYLLFLDRPHAARGKEAAKEVWNVGLLAVLTSVGAFGALCFSGFPVFVQLGQFTMLGIAISFIFVHTVFPKIFPEMPGGRPRALPLQRVADAMATTGKKGLWAAAAVAVVMVFFAKPVFNVSLKTMNTVGSDTRAADQLLADVWGDIFDKVFVLTAGDSLAGLHQQSDLLARHLEEDLQTGFFSAGFAPSMVFPGPERRCENFSAWKQFWTAEKIGRVKADIADFSGAAGFSTDAFADFFEMLQTDGEPDAAFAIPSEYFNFLGISKVADGSAWIQVATLTTGPAYDAQRFHDRYASFGRLFDPAFFSQRLGKLLFHTFLKLFVIIAASVAVLLLVFFVDITLTLVSLLPVAFALVTTLGTMNLIGHPLDIPGLMLSIVVLGMGIDYSLFFVRSYQRYGTLGHPSFGLIRMAVFMSAASTLIGFGTLCTADHSLLKSAGLTSFLGIGYSMIGAFVILPPVLGWMQKRRQAKAPKSVSLQDRVLNRYHNMEAYPRLFARFKMRFDPLFSELQQILKYGGDVKTIIDIGCGYGVPASWLLERFQDARLYGIEPSRERVRIASLAAGARGCIVQGRAPDLSQVPRPADLATMLDMVHFLDDEALPLTLARVAERLHADGRLIIRASIPPRRRFAWVWWLENAKLRFAGLTATYRSVEQLEKMIARAGFRIIDTLPSGVHDELSWLIAGTAPKEMACDNGLQA
ncbi:MAG: MMPL family transporter [Desulfobacterales bacterium]